MKKRALFSLSELDHAVDFGRILVELGWEIVASRETGAVLTAAGLSVVDVAEFVGITDDYGFPPTLHPKIEACLTAGGAERIDLVYVIPYSVSEGNDIGGMTLLALAAKGNRIPVMTVADMVDVMEMLKRAGDVPQAVRQELQERVVASMIRHYDHFLRSRRVLDVVVGSWRTELATGENPYQVPADLFASQDEDPLALTRFQQVSGDKPCFTNLADADNILKTMCLVVEAFNRQQGRTPFICIAAKHGNACGLGISWDNPSEAVEKALWGDPVAVWGGEVIVNFSVDENIALALYKSRRREERLGEAAWMLDVVMAPRFAPEAVKILGQRSARKLFENRNLLSPALSSSRYAYRLVRGGFLRQPPAHYVLDWKGIEIVGKELSPAEMDALIIAWAVAWSSNHGGNEIAIAKNGQLLSVGGGPSTIAAATTAVARCQTNGHDVGGAAFAADAFFPFIDAPNVLCQVGVKVGVVPQGGKQFNEVKEHFRKQNVNMVYLPELYRGFCRH